MKKIFFYALSIAMLVNLSACNDKAIKTPTYPKNTSFNDENGKIKNREKNQLDEKFKQSLNQFSFTSTSKILGGSNKNISYSPTSLYIALSMAGIGSKNTTQNEIFSALGISGKDVDYVSNQNSKLLKLLYCDNEIGKLKIANSIWLQKNMPFNKSFEDNVVNKFYAYLFNVNFDSKNTSKLMSSWISKNTNGNLSPDINIDKKQIMAILNTIYYKDEWIDRFDKNKTKADTFHLSNGSKIQCDFMNMTYSSHGFRKGSGYTTSSLDLKNGGSMVFILPDEGVSVESLIATPEKVAGLFNNQGSTFGKVIFQVPKFSYGNSLNLNDALESIGIKTAFKNNADFSGITNKKTFISKISQQTHIAVDEEGVEAAAFTKIDYMGSALPKSEVAKMILNRPFIFAIKSNDTILFIGIVHNPAEKQ